ncbi:tetratricopeptide repeat protein [Flavobacterium myungsuense]|uniref:Tetratricopeptide repeat protein n=1 Tax=Flavobacterium myungsuense TaxID=651823 RepID=A0ABW3IYP6_9FLAO
MKHILLTFTVLLISNYSFSQGNLKAKIEYENAEQAFAEEKYEDALTSLLEVENLLQKWTPNVSFLKIQALDKTFDYTNVKDKKTIMLIAEVEKYMNFSEKNEDAIVPDKFKTVYEIEQKVKPLLQIQKWEQMPDYIKGNEEYKKEKHLLAIEWFKKASNLGNGLADDRIAGIYEMGFTVEKDISSALKWYKLGAQKGCALAAYNIGYIYYKGKEVAIDYLEAMKWFKLASKNGHTEAINKIGVMYSDGKGVSKDNTEAMKWYRKGADLGYDTSILNIGWLYYHGNGVPKNNIEASKWFGMACEKNSSRGCLEIGKLYHYGEGVGIDYKLAYDFYNKAVELDSTNKDAWVYAGLLFEGGLGRDKSAGAAMECYKKAIENGDTWSLYKVGKIYKDYNFKDVSAEKEAVRYLTAAADKGHTEAMDLLVEIYAYGDRSVKRDRKLEKEWSQKSEAAKMSK